MQIQNYVMKREEVPECWLRPEDIIGHAIDELLEEEIDFEEFIA
jgi:hypothetical protein